jgi:hypothetical protein
MNETACQNFTRGSSHSQNGAAACEARSEPKVSEVQRGSEARSNAKAGEVNRKRRVQRAEGSEVKLA